MRILVTGGAGFIGSHIVDRYVEQGHDVVVVDDLSTGRPEYVNRKATFYNVSIEKPSVADIFREHKPEILNHHAAQIDVRKSVADPIFDARTNVLGTINLLQNSVKHGVKRVIFASTGGAIYGEQESFPADEDHATNPLSPYGVSKLVVENYLSYYKASHGLEYISLRYSNVYGQRQNSHGEAGVVAIFINKLLSSQIPVINGDGLQTRDFVYVDDVVKANAIALDTNRSGVFNISTGTETNINTIFRILIEIAGIDTEKVYGPPKLGEQRRSVLDNRKANNVLNWSPKVSLGAGLRRTVEFYLKEGVSMKD